MGGWRQLDDNTQWTGPSTLECASMEGRRVVIDVQHYPTALQVCHCALLMQAKEELCLMYEVLYKAQASFLAATGKSAALPLLRPALCMP